MLLPHDLTTHCVYIASVNSKVVLFTEVLCKTENLNDEQLKTVIKWKEFIINTLSKSPYTKQSKGIVLFHHMLSNYFKAHINTTPPFHIYIRVSNECSEIREWVRRRMRVLDKTNKLYVVKEKGIDCELKELEKGKSISNIYWFTSDKSYNLSIEPLALILAKSYSLMNRNNNSLLMINK